MFSALSTNTRRAFVSSSLYRHHNYSQVATTTTAGSNRLQRSFHSDSRLGGMMMPVVTLTDACVKHIMEHYRDRKMSPDQHKLRIKVNENPKIPDPIQYFFTENNQVDAATDVVIEKEGVGVVIDKKSLAKFEQAQLEVVDFELDEDNVARSTFTIRKQRGW